MMVEIRARAVVGAFELDVELEAKPGVTVLFGPTASGKTLTLRLIAGLIRPASGVVRPFGDLSPHERGIGYAPQHGALWPHKTAAEHLTALGTRARADELLARVGLETLADRRPLGLSGGERQRLAFARALVRSPAVLLLDEPFSALDDDARNAMGKIVREEAARGAVVLLVTHDREEAERLGGAFVAYRDGKARPQ